jgi:hypothetical protein
MEESGEMVVVEVMSSTYLECSGWWIVECEGWSGRWLRYVLRAFNKV